jgi:hypothetical protein
MHRVIDAILTLLDLDRVLDPNRRPPNVGSAMSSGSLSGSLIGRF